jgi:hypothetical protein
MRNNMHTKLAHPIIGEGHRSSKYRGPDGMHTSSLLPHAGVS